MSEEPYLDWLTTDGSRNRLNARELEMYREHRKNVLRWMWYEGKNPEARISYAEETVKNRSYRLDQCYRWVWDIEDGYTETITVSHSNACMKQHQWNVGLRTRTAKILEQWLEERERYDKYDDSDLLWLTRYGNPYGSKSLNRRFRKLLDEAGIDRSNRNITWYSIRHSVGREMVKEMGMGGAAAQLRHKSLRSTLRYVRPSAEERKDALDRMG